MIYFLILLGILTLACIVSLLIGNFIATGMNDEELDDPLTNHDDWLH